MFDWLSDFFNRGIQTGPVRPTAPAGYGQGMDNVIGSIIQRGTQTGPIRPTAHPGLLASMMPQQGGSIYDFYGGGFDGNGIDEDWSNPSFSRQPQGAMDSIGSIYDFYGGSNDASDINADWSNPAVQAKIAKQMVQQNSSAQQKARNKAMNAIGAMNAVSSKRISKVRNQAPGSQQNKAPSPAGSGLLALAFLNDRNYGKNGFQPGFDSGWNGRQWW